MADLKTNYVDDVLDASVNDKRKYNMIQNADGTVSFDDVTAYTQNGDSFGAKDVNDTNTAVNVLNENLDKLNVLALSEIKVINYTRTTQGYNSIPYPDGYNKDNCTILSYMSYAIGNNSWYFAPGGDVGICQLTDDAINVYAPDTSYTKTRIVLGKFTE